MCLYITACPATLTHLLLPLPAALPPPQGFAEGVMEVGPYAGRKVSEVKPIIRNEMVAAGQAVMYSEPEKSVSRPLPCPASTHAHMHARTPAHLHTYVGLWDRRHDQGGQSYFIHSVIVIEVEMTPACLPDPVPARPGTARHGTAWHGTALWRACMQPLFACVLAAAACRMTHES